MENDLKQPGPQAQLKIGEAYVIKPPAQPGIHPKYFHIFLGGSIEMGKAVDWQKDVEQHFKDQQVVLLNPRRDDYDPNARQEKNDPYFRGQVLWELDCLDRADLILMYFQPDTKSPVSLLELGLYARTGKLLICCPEGYWRKGNVDLVCERYNIPQVNSLQELLNYAQYKVSRNQQNQALL